MKETKNLNKEKINIIQLESSVNGLITDSTQNINRNFFNLNQTTKFNQKKKFLTVNFKTFKIKNNECLKNKKDKINLFSSSNESTKNQNINKYINNIFENQKFNPHYKKTLNLKDVLTNRIESIKEKSKNETSSKYLFNVIDGQKLTQKYKYVNANFSDNMKLQNEILTNKKLIYSEDKRVFNEKHFDDVNTNSLLKMTKSCFFSSDKKKRSIEEYKREISENKLKLRKNFSAILKNKRDLEKFFQNNDQNPFISENFDKEKNNFFRFRCKMSSKLNEINFIDNIGNGTNNLNEEKKSDNHQNEKEIVQIKKSKDLFYKTFNESKFETGFARLRYGSLKKSINSFITNINLNSNVFENPKSPIKISDNEEGNDLKNEIIPTVYKHKKAYNDYLPQKNDLRNIEKKNNIFKKCIKNKENTVYINDFLNLEFPLENENINSDGSITISSERKKKLNYDSLRGKKNFTNINSKNKNENFYNYLNKHSNANQELENDIRYSYEKKNVLSEISIKRHKEELDKVEKEFNFSRISSENREVNEDKLRFENYLNKKLKTIQSKSSNDYCTKENLIEKKEHLHKNDIYKLNFCSLKKENPNISKFKYDIKTNIRNNHECKVENKHNCNFISKNKFFNFSSEKEQNIKIKVNPQNFSASLNVKKIKFKF